MPDCAACTSALLFQAPESIGTSDLVAMGAVEQDESWSACLSSSTTWLLADGSLVDSISFETSSSDATVNGAGAIPSGVLLVRPADSQPCDITEVEARRIFLNGSKGACGRFDDEISELHLLVLVDLNGLKLLCLLPLLFDGMEKHEIHSIYVQSTARVYELYFSNDQNASSKEYLCTVRCGASVQERNENVSEGTITNCLETNDVKEILARSGSSSFEEDGWIDVKIPDSFLQDSRMFSSLKAQKDSPKTQIHYEATAQISDASPCKSITLRLLSLQTISSVHIGEIYIYADPVLDTDPEPAVSNMGAGPLLSMLVPGFLEMSKSRLQDKSLCDASGGSKESLSSEGAIHVNNPAKLLPEMKLDDLSMASSKKVIDPQASKSNFDDINKASGCVEDVMNVPISEHTRDDPRDKQMRSAFEAKGPYESCKPNTGENNAPSMHLEKILDDLVSRVGRIETFCSRFEEKMIKPLTCIDMRLQRLEEQLDAFSKIPQPTGIRISPPEFSAEESDSETKGSISSFTVKDSSSVEKQATVGKLGFHSPESAKSSGLIVRAPEFPSEESDSSGGNSVDLTPDHPEDKKRLSVDGALASALTALLTSTTNISSVMLREYQNTDKDDVGYSTYSVPMEDRNNTFNFDFAEKGCDEIDQAFQSRFNEVDPEKNYLDEESWSCYIAKADNLSCNDSLSVDDLSIEIKVHGPESLIIKAPEFPIENDILEWGVSSDPHIQDYFALNSHIHHYPETTLTLASFLSSRNAVTYNANKLQLSDRVASSEGESATKADPFPVGFSRSDTQSEKFDLHDQHNAVVLREDTLKVASRHENPVSTQADFSLVDLFLLLDLSEQPEMENVHPTAVLGEETSNSSILHQENGSALTCNLLPCIELLADASAVMEQSWGGHFNGGNTAVRGHLFDLLNTFDDFKGSKPVDLTTGNIRSSKTVPKSQMNTLVDLQQVSNLIADHENFINNVHFCADESLGGGGLPLEILLGEKSNEKLKDHEHDNDGDIETSQQQNSLEIHDLNQNCATVKMTLIDMEDLTVQDEAQGMVPMGMNDISQSTESCSSPGFSSSLI
ncbi:hypothetical protein AXF42_Ash010357 [Apostasia shenzhenica]|uniref:Uncharacterized protein n=1 Tax=Apostasia shenzhenica TaxID=1088818 RepID=A0A2I0BDT8_9ASPA|nr:hypothetical protein AXF42_Ash010357 [Apostasia shenzhenica]